MRTALIKAIKDSMRMSTASAIIEDDISGCIEACFKDLQLAGVEKIDDTDALIIRAAQLFTKADFNYNNLADKYRQSYDALKMSLALSGEYNTKKARANNVWRDNLKDAAKRDGNRKRKLYAAR